MTDKIERGHQADQLLNNEVFIETLRALEASYVETWKIADTTEAREDLHRYIVMIGQLKADLRSIANTGMLERKRQDVLTGKPSTIHSPLWREPRG